MRRTPASVEWVVRRHHLHKPPAWSEEDKVFAKQHYMHMPYKQIAARLNNSAGSVKVFIQRQKMPKRPPSWSENDKKIVLQNFGHRSYKEIGDLIGKTKSSVAGFVRKNILLKNKS